MSAPKVIVLVIDRLGAAYLGPYGNTWLETAGFNRLAAESLVVEQMLAASPDLATTYEHYWRGNSDSSASLAKLARTAGYRCVLLTDSTTVAELPIAADFDEIQLLPTKQIGRSPPQDIADTAFIRLMEAAAEQLASGKDLPQPQFLWIHASAMNGPWDAPQDLREQFADEDDPPPAEIVEPPQEMLAAEHDPDQVLSLTHAYAGQVALVDLGLQALLAAIDDLPHAEQLFFAVTSPRGFPLGEHRRIGDCDQALYGELLHVPCLLRFPQQEGALLRTQELIQPRDLQATIGELFGTTDTESNSRSLLRVIRGEPTIRRDFVQAMAPDQLLIRTAAWQLRVVQGEAENRYELYVKPDDRHEFNDVASRAQDVVRQLVEIGEGRKTDELPTELTSPWR